MPRHSSVAETEPIWINEVLKSQDPVMSSKPREIWQATTEDCFLWLTHGCFTISLASPFPIPLRLGELRLQRFFITKFKPCCSRRCARARATRAPAECPSSQNGPPWGWRSSSRPPGRRDQGAPDGASVQGSGSCASSGRNWRRSCLAPCSSRRLRAVAACKEGIAAGTVRIPGAACISVSLQALVTVAQ